MITTRINYFLYHTLLQMDASQKLKASSAFLQIKVGLKDHFLQASHALYGHWATNTLIQQIWNETETHELHQTCRKNSVDTTTPMLIWPLYDGICYNHLFKKLSNKINRCHLYLQVITFYDIIIYGGKQIHPNILIGIDLHHVNPHTTKTDNYGKNSP